MSDSLPTTSELDLDELFDMTDVIAAADVPAAAAAAATDLPPEWDLTTIVMRHRFWLTCRVRDGGCGAPITISY